MNETMPPKDNAGVQVHPPFFFLGALLIGCGIHSMRPWPIAHTHSTALRVLGGGLAVLGIAFIAWGRRILVSHGTNVNPTRPTTTIVTSGPYRFTRNPLYLGLTTIYLGLSLAVNTWWTLILLLPVFLVMHFCVVLREERYLEGKFGDSYQQYRRRVRRYL